MDRRAFTSLISKSTFAATVTGLWLVRDVSASRSLSIDDRALLQVVDPLLLATRPVRAITTDAGSLVRFQADGRVAHLVTRNIENWTDLQVKLEKVEWKYHADSRLTDKAFELARYQNSISQVVHERSEVIGTDRADVRDWFEGHERLFRRMAVRLSHALRSGWRADGDVLLHRVGRLRGELDPDRHVQIAPGESYRITITGESDTTAGDTVDLRYDRVKDRFDCVVTVRPRGESVEHFEPHREVLQLTGDGSLLPTRYRLTSWQDGTIGATYTPSRGGEHPLFARKKVNAQRLIEYFPRYI